MFGHFGFFFQVFLLCRDNCPQSSFNLKNRNETHSSMISPSCGL